MDVPTALKVAVAQLLIVGAAFAILALALDKEFFEDWGWLTGPVAWLASAAIVARLLRLPLAQTLTGAVAAGAVSALLVVAGLHLVGMVVSIALFALWCGHLRSDAELPAETI